MFYGNNEGMSEQGRPIRPENETEIEVNNAYFILYKKLSSKLLAFISIYFVRSAFIYPKKQSWTYCSSIVKNPNPCCLSGLH